MDTAFFYKVLSLIHQTNSITMVADILQYSQSGLSHAINRFEKEIGFKLLQRNKNGIFLTKEALILLPIAQDIEKDLNRMEIAIRHIKGEKSRVLTIGSFTSIIRKVFPEITSCFLTDYPDISIRIMRGSIGDIQGWIQNRSIDLAITSLQPEDTYDYIHLVDEPMYALVPASYGKKIFLLSDIIRYPFIVPSDKDLSPDNDFRRILSGYRSKITAQIISTDWSTIPQMVSLNMGISILPRLCISEVPAGVMLLPIAPPCLRKLVVSSCRNFAHVPPYIQTFIEYTKAILPGSIPI